MSLRLAGRRVLITGATGFIGAHLVAELNRQGAVVRTISGRKLAHTLEPPGVGDADTIIHLAARVHVMKDAARDPITEFRRANLETTRLLLDAATAAGTIPHFIYMSSVKAVAETGLALNEETLPAPVDAYGISKREAEELVLSYARTGAVRATILRLPLVYGPGMKGNMLRLFSAVGRGLPLPFGAIHNQRSILYVHNLIEVLIKVLECPQLKTGILFVADNPPISTAGLVRGIAGAMNRKPRLVPIPERFFRKLTPILGEASIDRLAGSLTVDIRRLHAETGYRQPWTIDEGLTETAGWFMAERYETD